MVYEKLFEKSTKKKSYTSAMRWLVLVPVCFALLPSLVTSQQESIRSDPAPILYPGQVNIALISNVHGPGGTGGGCGALRPEAVQRAMAAVWAAHQANYRKEDPAELNIGVYIYDTCGREDVAERQVYRLLGHVGHVQTTDCAEKRIPALFAAITEGDTESLRIPLKLLQAFSVPVISTSGPPLPQTLSTAPSTHALAKAAVSVLRHLRLPEVAVMAEEGPALSGLLEAFTLQAQSSGMQALQLDNRTDHGTTEDMMASLRLISEYGKSRLKAVVFLIGSDQALQLLNSVDEASVPGIPWVVVTPSDISADILNTFQREQISRLQKVLLLSPESPEVPEFDDYFRQLLDEETIRYHPLLVEYLQAVGGNITAGTTDEDPGTTSATTPTPPAPAPAAGPSDVSPVVRAVWSLSAALRTVQRRSCRRGTDCLLYLRRSLSAYVGRAATDLDHVIGEGDLRGTRLRFDGEGRLTSTRYGLRGFTFRGDIMQAGFYSDDEGLSLDSHVMESLTESATVTPPPVEFKFKFKSTPRTTPSDATTRKVEWKILEDTAMAAVTTTTQKIVADESTTLPNDIDLVVALRDEGDLQSLSNGNASRAASMLLGPSYVSERRAPPSSSSSSNLRSISLTSHQEPRINDAYSREDSRQDAADRLPAKSTGDGVRVVAPPPLRAWLGRPASLAVLGCCALLSLAALYILVFLMMKACEGALRRTGCLLAAAQLVALLCLHLSAALYAWKPSPLLCGLQRAAPNVSLAACYGAMLLKGMYLRAQNSLGLGGSVSRLNQMLTLLFVVGVQVALEAQWWAVRPLEAAFSAAWQECTTGKAEILQSQAYVIFLLLLATALAVSTRRIPYNQSEGRSLVATCLACLAISLSWCAACWLLPSQRGVAAPAALLATSAAVLGGVFGPQLFAIHRHGGFPHKPLSYADSLSTVFTMFKDNNNLDGASSGGGTTARGRKVAKTLETPFAAEGTRNPLYSEYQSAYP